MEQPSASRPTGTSRWKKSLGWVSSPAVNSSESPGRKNPKNSPDSAKMMAKMPRSPKLTIRFFGSRPSTAKARIGRTGYRSGPGAAGGARTRSGGVEHRVQPVGGPPGHGFDGRRFRLGVGEHRHR